MLNRKWTGHALVTLQLIGIGLSMLSLLLTPEVQWIYLPITGAGIGFGAYVLFYNRPGNFSVHPRPSEHARLVTSGPYRYVRHPMYLAVSMTLLGCALAAMHMLGWVGFALATASMIGKTSLEEAYLIERFPEYSAYQATSKRLIPFLF